MSRGLRCRCSASREPDRPMWRVNQYRVSISSFGGTPQWDISDYSEVACRRCGARWRTKAAYVQTLWVRDLM